MGESKRRKQLLGDRYGLPNINAQVQNAWENINICITKATLNGGDYVICQCCRDDKGYHLDAINQLKQELETWECPLNVPMVIQMLPEAFKPSETKLFDGFITVWTNKPDCEIWKTFLETKLQS